jgi:phospholipid transport system substrate-binding protein
MSNTHKNTSADGIYGPFMSISRRLILGAPVAALLTQRTAKAADSDAPALISRLYGDLLAVMKVAKRTPFDERYNRLSPTISRTFDLPLMTRLAVGPSWAQIDPAQQQRLVAAFSRYTISVYANRFDDFGGERFEVTPTATSNANGVLVTSRLVKNNGEIVPLNYLMRQDGTGGWRVIDIYLSGTISELAARRSEFAAVLQRNGVEGLVQMIEQRTAALRTG